MIGVKFIFDLLHKEAHDQTTGNDRCDLSGDIDTHRMHKQEVLIVFFLIRLSSIHRIKTKILSLKIPFRYRKSENDLFDQRCYHTDVQGDTLWKIN